MNKIVRAYSTEGIKKEYFMWLCDIVETTNSREDKLNLDFLIWLHSKEFTWSLPNDDNRIEDGKRLRYEYCEEYMRRNCEIGEEPCSVFEMLVALAIRIDFNTSKAPDDHQVAKYFWEMIDNIGFKLLPSIFQKKENEEKLSIFINREYDYDGKGGLFPIRNPRRDQRRVEIWYQMMTYVEENYG